MTSVCQGLSLLAPGGKMRDPGNEVGGHCVVFLGKTLYLHSASLNPGTQMGTSEFNAGGNPVMD